MVQISAATMLETARFDDVFNRITSLTSLVSTNVYGADGQVINVETAGMTEVDRFGNYTPDWWESLTQDGTYLYAGGYSEPAPPTGGAKSSIAVKLMGAGII
jgi:hypothetical protein